MSLGDNTGSFWLGLSTWTLCISSIQSFWCILIPPFFWSICNPRYLNVSVYSLLIAYFFLICSITFSINYSVPAQKKSSTYQDRIPCNWLFWCHYKKCIIILFIPPLFNNSFFTQKYHADLISTVFIFHLFKLMINRINLRFSLPHVGESFLVVLASISSKPCATNCALVLERPSINLFCDHPSYWYLTLAFIVYFTINLFAVP